jgi:hypothetical protein
MVAHEFAQDARHRAKLMNAIACVAEILFIAMVAAAAIWVATRPIARLDVMEIIRTE